MNGLQANLGENKCARKITAWKCPHTAKLFEDEMKYRAHLKRLSRKRIKTKAWDDWLEAAESMYIEAQLVNNAQELCDHFMAHQKEFILLGLLKGWMDTQSAVTRALKNSCRIEFPEMAYIKMSAKYQDSVSNSHHCPRNGKTNWGGQVVGAPKGYPGWHGRIESDFVEKKPVVIIHNAKGKKKEIAVPSMNSMVGYTSMGDKSPCGINTGSGSGGSHSRYELMLFADDFPNITKQLKGNTI